MSLFGDIFTIGNVITLIIVAVVLAVYRQLDQNNKSLSKIKRYSDKVIGELDGFVDDKTVELKNLSIELDAHQKRGKEILKRIQNVEEGLETKASSIDIMYKRIEDYDKALNELVTMTSNVKVNLDRLEKESEFVDNVGRTLKDANQKIIQIEKSIPALKSEFAKENSRELKILSSEVLKRAKKIAISIENEVGESDSRIKEFAEYLTGLEERRDQLEKESFANIENTFDEYLQKAENTGDDFLNQYKTEVAAVESDYLDRLKTAAENGENFEHEVFTGLKELINMNAQTVEKGVSLWKDKVDTFETTLTGRIDSLAEDMTRRETEISGKISRVEAINDDIDTLEKKLRELMDENENNMQDLKESLHNRIKEQLKDLKTTFDSDLDEKNIEVNENLKTSVLQFKENIDDFEKRINDQFGGVEIKISEYEGNIAYRFVKIEEIGKDIDTLEVNLRKVMERISDRIESDFQEFEKNLEIQRGDAAVKSDNEIKQIYSTIDELEKEISELKSRAYENVSEKLQIFEDDFFSDLKKRDAEMKDQLISWQQEVNNNLDDITVESENERTKVEKEYAEELKARLAEIQNRIYQHHEKIDNQVSGFQTRIDERMGLALNTMQGFEDTIKKDIQEAKDNSHVFFQKEFTEHNTNISNRLLKHERDVDTEVKTQGTNLELGKKELYSVMETAQSDVVVWQAKVLQTIKDAETISNEDVAAFKAAISIEVSTIREEFTSQREDLILNTQDERARLKNEVKELTDNVIELESDLRKKTETSLETFNRDYESFSIDIQKKFREMQLGADQKVKDFRSNANEISEKIEQLQKKMFGTIEDKAKSLAITLNEIDKKQKNFLAQTKIFDRADTLKIALQENIEDLKLEITRVDAQGKEIKEAERKFLSIKKTGEEIDSKLNRFLVEKRRIEEMEGDFKKLINISQAVDVKLDQVVTSNDELQEIQVRIRKIEELEKDVEQKYERLEKKKFIIDDTTAGVDRNFQQLSALEARFQDMEDGLTIIPGKISTMENQLKILSENKQKTENAIKQLAEINKILDDIDNRAQKMEKAREWLARTETRLEEVSNQAQEQVKLLGTIMKDTGKSGKGEKGAPSMGAREVVTRLAHQGWSVQEIARATKLSRGEVELILELLPRS